MQLFGHQIESDNKIEACRAAGAKNVLLVSPTGSGKTVIFSHRLKRYNCSSAAIAHRSELVGQMSYALARFGVRHRVVAPNAMVKQINQMHLLKLGKSFYDPNAQCAVVSVQTLIAQKEKLRTWGRSVQEWITDEAHHLLKDNMWGTAVELFPNARGLGVTAYSGRADGRGLGRHAHGVFDALVQGPQMRDLINAGLLVDYRIFVPPSDLNMIGAAIGSSGDYTPDSVKKRVRESHVIGDVVKHYLRIAPGKLGITFASDVETATDIANQFNACGVPAAVVHSGTPTLERAALLGKFERREILQLVNVDLFGEGYDLPALEVVSMARPTLSFQLFLQQFGRVLRTLDGKSFGIIIDHVGNVVRHGLPDAYREETLDSRERGSRGAKSDAIPMRACLNPSCCRAYEAIYKACPYCGHSIEPASRAKPEFVDGDATEIDAATLAAMRGLIEQQMAFPAIPYGASPVVAQGIRNRHLEKCQTQIALREAIAWWAGWQKYRGLNESQSYRAFYFRFGVDVLTAQTLNRADSQALLDRINTHIEKMSLAA